MSDTTPITTADTPPPRQQAIDTFVLLLFAGGLTVGLGLILALNPTATQQVAVELGQRASETIEAPRTITYRSEVLTEQARQQVTRDIFQYTPLDRAIGREQTNLARDLFRFVEVVRADPLADNARKIEYLQAADDISISADVARLLITLSPAEYNTAKNETLAIVATLMQQDIRQDGLNAARDSVRRRLSFELNVAQEQVVSTLAPQFIRPNVFYDESATQQAREQAAAEVQPVEQVITRGQPVIRVGEIVEPRHIEALEQLGLLQQQTDWRRIGAAMLMALLSTTILMLYWHRFQQKQNRPLRHLAILTTLILIFAIIARVMLLSPEPTAYLFPAAALGLLLTVISDARLAMVSVTLLAALTGFMSTGNALEMAMYTAVGSFVALLTLTDTERFYAFFRAGLFGAAGNIAVVTLFQLTEVNTSVTEVGVLLGAAVVSALFLAPLLTIGGFFFVGLFGVTTVVQLQDLSRLDHPLLQELLRRAPGTYHHSIMVANLAEQAAERIDANSTLVRVGAFYHDIGKMNRPPFFTENQEGINPHDSLDPYTSARIIVSHVSDGLEMARKYGLPQRIRDFIAEHHGDNVLKVFYERAKQANDDSGEDVDVSLFKYAGPRPRTRETGIVLLADTIEAASTALRPSTGAEIEKLVNSLVDNHLKAGQLDHADLTMGDLKEVRASFIETLKGRYHVRVKYPGNERMMGKDDEAAETPPARPTKTDNHE